MTISENVVCEDKMDYVKIALAIETLAYHNKDYLSPELHDNSVLSEEIQCLLRQAIKNNVSPVKCADSYENGYPKRGELINGT